MSSKVAVPFYILASSEWEFLLLPIFTSIWDCQCFGFGNSNGFGNFNAVVSPCYFDLHFPGDIQCGASFYMLVCFYVYLLQWGVCSYLWPVFLIGLFIFLLSFKSSLYLCNSPLLGHVFCKYILLFCGLSSHSVDSVLKSRSF